MSDRIYAVGDIHGSYDKLLELLDKIDNPLFGGKVRLLFDKLILFGERDELRQALDEILRRQEPAFNLEITVVVIVDESDALLDHRDQLVGGVDRQLCISRTVTASSTSARRFRLRVPALPAEFRQLRRLCRRNT